MDVSVIIVNYNTRLLTHNCIDSIFKYTKDVDFEVIVVDNASTDGSLEYFKEDNRIKYIYSNENLGFGRANNLGYQYAQGKYLFLLNSDTVLLNNAIGLFYDNAEKETNLSVGCWGTMMYDSNRKITISYGGFLSLWKDIYFMLFYPIAIKLSLIAFLPKIYNYPTYDGIVDFISGADLFMKKEVADKYGLFDPFYFLYCEETDMQRRFNHFNVYSKIIHSPKIIHFNGGSQKKGVNYKMNIIKLKSKIYYFKKWNNPLLFYAYAFSVTLLKIPIFLISRQPVHYKLQYLKTLWG